MQTTEKPLSQLLVDPNNYRLQDNDSFAQVAPERFHLERVQNGTLKRLRDEGIKALRDSIVSNGFLPIERIVITPYEHDENKFLVIEGNRRIAALNMIKSEYDSGVDIPEEVVEVFENVPCVLVESDGQVEYFKETLMGIRHVGGIQEWGGYQRAKLIADLKDEHEVDLGEVAQKLGLSSMEVNRRYRAYKALEQMENDEEFGDLAVARLYPLFHEAVSLPLVREWLGWEPEQFEFTNAEAKENFYKMITPRPGEEEQDASPPKISTYQDVRALRDILPNPDAKADLLNLERSVADALSIAKTKAMSKRWRTEILEARTSLENIGAIEVQQFTVNDRELIQSLIETANAILQIQSLPEN